MLLSTILYSQAPSEACNIRDMKITPTIHRYLSQIGQRGGENGRGAVKDRGVAFYRDISAKGLATRRANAAARLAKVAE
jgi:hypothetical protein